MTETRLRVRDGHLGGMSSNTKVCRDLMWHRSFLKDKRSHSPRILLENNRLRVWGPCVDASCPPRGDVRLTNIRTISNSRDSGAEGYSTVFSPSISPGHLLGRQVQVHLDPAPIFDVLRHPAEELRPCANVTVRPKRIPAHVCQRHLKPTW